MSKPVDAMIVLASEVSQGVDDEEFELQRTGYAAAVTYRQFPRQKAVLGYDGAER